MGHFKKTNIIILKRDLFKWIKKYKTAGNKLKKEVLTGYVKNTTKLYQNILKKQKWNKFYSWRKDIFYKYVSSPNNSYI